MKNGRQKKIIELIENHDIETQEELANRLNDEGYNVTQATISRDIRQLALTKIATSNGKQKYIQVHNPVITTDNKHLRILREGYVSAVVAGNLLVIHTSAGMANAVAAAIDALRLKEVLGSLAGDDTIMCATKNEAVCRELYQKMIQIIQGA